MSYKVIAISKTIKHQIWREEKNSLIDEVENSRTLTSNFLHIPHPKNLKKLKIDPNKFCSIRGANQIFK